MQAAGHFSPDLVLLFPTQSLFPQIPAAPPFGDFKRTPLSGARLSSPAQQALFAGLHRDANPRGRVKSSWEARRGHAAVREGRWPGLAPWGPPQGALPGTQGYHDVGAAPFLPHPGSQGRNRYNRRPSMTEGGVVLGPAAHPRAQLGARGISKPPLETLCPCGRPQKLGFAPLPRLPLISTPPLTSARTSI